MGETISFRLSKGVKKDLEVVEKKWHTDRSEVIRRLLSQALSEWKIQNALEEISSHKISVGKGAKNCDISVWEMFDMIKKKNIDWTGFSDEDLKESLDMLK